MAIFQSFSNTYGDVSRLVSLYEEALSYPGAAGLVIATRPDCLADGLLDWFERRFGNKAPEGHPYLLVELGVESTEDRTLERINRGHDFNCSRHAERISALPVTTVKLHHLREDIVVDRIFSESPKSMVIAPAWGLKPSQIAISSL